MDAKGRFNFHRGGSISQRRAIFAAHFATAKLGGCAAKWHSCAKGVFRSYETPYEIVFWLRKWSF